jgi:predicted phage tail protein
MSRETMPEDQANQDLDDLKKDVNSLLVKSDGLEKEMSDMRTDMETRLRVMESSNIEGMKNEMRDLESRIRIIEMAGDSRKQTFNTAVNFVVQILWVCMASYILAKLGLHTL